MVVNYDYDVHSIFTVDNPFPTAQSVRLAFPFSLHDIYGDHQEPETIEIMENGSPVTFSTALNYDLYSLIGEQIYYLDSLLDSYWIHPYLEDADSMSQVAPYYQDQSFEMFLYWMSDFAPQERKEFTMDFTYFSGFDCCIDRKGQWKYMLDYSAYWPTSPDCYCRIVDHHLGFSTISSPLDDFALTDHNVLIGNTLTAPLQIHAIIESPFGEVVLDMNDDIPIPNAAILVDGMYDLESNYNGKYLLPALQPGTHYLNVWKNGFLQQNMFEFENQLYQIPAVEMQAQFPVDLSLFEKNISIDPVISYIGDVVSLNAEIINFGTEAVGPVHVEYYDGNPNEGGIFIGSTQVSSIQAGGIATTEEVHWQPFREGLRYIYCIIDPNSSISEYSESNNSGYTLGYVLSQPGQHPPIIYLYSPTELDTVLLDQTIEFQVSAIDPDGDFLSYRWTLNDELISADSFAAVTFDSLGDFRVTARVSDGSLADSVIWNVTVVESSNRKQVPFLPTEFALHPPYPNPFNSTTRISFSLPKQSFVKLVIYNIEGRELVRLCEGAHDAGKHEVIFNANGFPSGVYFCYLNATDFSAVKKIMLTK